MFDYQRVVLKNNKKTLSIPGAYKDDLKKSNLVDFLAVQSLGLNQASRRFSWSWKKEVGNIRRRSINVNHQPMGIIGLSVS